MICVLITGTNTEYQQVVDFYFTVANNYSDVFLKETLYIVHIYRSFDGVYGSCNYAFLHLEQLYGCNTMQNF